MVLTNDPVNFNTAFCDCVGPPVGVAVKPAGTVRVSGTPLVSAMVCTPPNKPSKATKSLFTGVSQVPTSLPRVGTERPILDVWGSAMAAS